MLMIALVILPAKIAARTSDNENVFVNLHHLFLWHPRTRMQVVHVLCDEQESIRMAGQFRNRSVPGIRLRAADALAPFAIPFPNQLWIARERFRRCQLCRIEVPPITVLPAKRRDAAISGNTRTCDYENTHGKMRVVAALVSSAFGAPGGRALPDSDF